MLVSTLIEAAVVDDGVDTDAVRLATSLAEDGTSHSRRLARTVRRA